MIRLSLRQLRGHAVVAAAALAVIAVVLGALAPHLYVSAVRPCLTTDAQACQAALAPLHLRDVISYQPASRFWAFQWYEAGIFLALAVALAGWSAWWLSRHRVT